MTPTNTAAEAAKLSREDIICIAADRGFMISTAYGQDFSQKMPVSDTGTLVAFARAIEEAVTADLRAQLAKQQPVVDFVTDPDNWEYEDPTNGNPCWGGKRVWMFKRAETLRAKVEAFNAPADGGVE